MRSRFSALMAESLVMQRTEADDPRSTPTASGLAVVPAVLRNPPAVVVAAVAKSTGPSAEAPPAGFIKTV